MPSSRLILCRPFLPPSIFPSLRVFSKESVLQIRWPEDWSFSIGPSKNERTESDVRNYSPAACSGAPSSPPLPACACRPPPAPQGWVCTALVTSLFPSEKSGSSPAPFHNKQGLELRCSSPPFSRQLLIPRVNGQ